VEPGSAFCRASPSPAEESDFLQNEATDDLAQERKLQNELTQSPCFQWLEFFEKYLIHTVDEPLPLAPICVAPRRARLRQSRTQPSEGHQDGEIRKNNYQKTSRGNAQADRRRNARYVLADPCRILPKPAETS
jgi:hypothetical protein